MVKGGDLSGTQHRKHAKRGARPSGNPTKVTSSPARGSFWLSRFLSSKSASKSGVRKYLGNRTLNAATSSRGCRHVKRQAISCGNNLQKGHREISSGIEPSQWHINRSPARRFYQVRRSHHHRHDTAWGAAVFHRHEKACPKCLVGSQRISRQHHGLCWIQSALSQTRTPVGTQSRQRHHGESNETRDHAPSRFLSLLESLVMR